jgi:hypothetical protein
MVPKACTPSLSDDPEFNTTSFSMSYYKSFMCCILFSILKASTLSIDERAIASVVWTAHHNHIVVTLTFKEHRVRAFIQSMLVVHIDTITAISNTTLTLSKGTFSLLKVHE